MSYAIKPDGSYRAVDATMELEADEILYNEVPQWVYNLMEANRIKAEQAAIEDAWRVREVAFITDQLMGVEDGDPSALPGTEAEWRAYRTAARAWKEGAENFPDQEHRPSRPE
jgi:hypothetical protein